MSLVIADLLEGMQVAACLKYNHCRICLCSVLTGLGSVNSSQVISWMFQLCSLGCTYRDISRDFISNFKIQEFH